MKKILKEFREFAVQGNMIDMAVGMIIGAAFKDLVNSLVRTFHGQVGFQQYVYFAERRTLRDFS